MSQQNLWRSRQRNRINVRNPEDIRIWTMSLGVSEGELREAILAAGVRADKVRAYLQTRH